MAQQNNNDERLSTNIGCNSTPTLQPSPHVTAQNDLVISELQASTLRRRRDSYRNGEPIIRTFGYNNNGDYNTIINHELTPKSISTKYTPIKLTAPSPSVTIKNLACVKPDSVDECQRSACGTTIATSSLSSGASDGITKSTNIANSHIHTSTRNIHDHFDDNHNNCMASPKPNLLLPNFSISPYTDRRPFKLTN